MGDGRAEGSSAIGDGGQAAVSLTPDIDGTVPTRNQMHVRILEGLQLEGSYIGDLLHFKCSDLATGRVSNTPLYQQWPGGPPEAVS